MDEQHELTLREYASVAWRRKWMVILAVVVTALVALVLTLLTTPRYRATADVLVRVAPNAVNIGAADTTANPRFIENQLTLARGAEVEAATRAVVGDEPDLSVQATADSDIFSFTATSTNAENAAVAANVFAREYIEAQRSASLREFEIRRAALEEQMSAIDGGEIDETRREEFERDLERIVLSIELVTEGGSTVVDGASVPSTPYEPTPSRTLLFAVVVGLLIGLGGAFLVDYLDTSIRGEQDLETASGLPTLAVIPQIPGSRDRIHVVTRSEPNSPPVEAYRDLRTAVRFLALDRDLDLLQVTSPRPGDGKTTTAANLAVVCAFAGQRTILVDCDLRRPRLHDTFGVSNAAGFTSVLLDGLPIQDVVHRVDGVPNLVVIPSGPLPPDPSELLSGASTSALLQRLGSLGDLVVIDSAPILPITDSVALSAAVDGVILVASAATADGRQVARSVGRLSSVDAPLLGTVLNGDASKDTDLYRYSYGASETARQPQHEEESEAQVELFDG